MFFDPTEIRLARSEAKQAIGISIGHSRWYTFTDEDSFAKFYRFWFIESSKAQEQSDDWKEDGVYTSYRRV